VLVIHVICLCFLFTLRPFSLILNNRHEWNIFFGITCSRRGKNGRGVTRKYEKEEKEKAELVQEATSSGHPSGILIL